MPAAQAREPPRHAPGAAARPPGGCEHERQSVYFTQEDPIGLAGGLNLYGYADSDPINLSDPFGLSAQQNDGEQSTSDSTGQEEKKKEEGYLACVQRMASANVENFDETVAGWFGATSRAAGHAAGFGVGVLAQRGMEASGLATSSRASLAGRWLLNKSAVPPMRPMLIQGIRVGATSTGALTTSALAAGIATNAAAGAAVYYGFRGGVRVGSYAVGMHLCSGK